MKMLCLLLQEILVAGAIGSVSALKRPGPQVAEVRPWTQALRAATSPSPLALMALLCCRLCSVNTLAAAAHAFTSSSKPAARAMAVGRVACM